MNVSRSEPHPAASSERLPPTAPPRVPVTRIQASRGWVSLRLGEFWAYRELLYFLVWRDVKVRYRQTVLGALWAVLQPFLTMVVFSIFFGRLARVPSDAAPYPIFAYAAIVPWALFANGLTQAANSLVGSANLIRKVYFPRMTVPVAAVLASLVDFVLAFAVLLGMSVYYGIEPTARLVWVAPFVLMTLVTALGVGLWLAAMNVQFRDVRHAVPFLVQLWMFATPIAYPTSLVPEEWRTVYALNPMVGVIDGFRWALLGSRTPSALVLAMSGATAVLLLISGAFYFRRMERTFADVV